MTLLRNGSVVSEGVSFNVWCGGSDLRHKWLFDNHAYWEEELAFHIRFRRHLEIWRRLFIVCHNVKEFAGPPAHCGKVFVPVLSWLSRYYDTRLLYVPTRPVFSYCSSIFKSFCSDKRRVEIEARTENVLKTLGCVSAACEDGNASHFLDIFSSVIIAVVLLFGY